MQHAAQILQAIAVFEQSIELDMQSLMEKLKYKATSGQLSFATALYRFLPFAYCQEILPEVNYPNFYLRPDKSQFLLVSNALFGEIKKVVEAKFLYGLAENQILAVLDHSPQFQEINKALHEGSILKNIEVSPLRF